jgi:hypothetical protein
MRVIAVVPLELGIHPSPARKRGAVDRQGKRRATPRGAKHPTNAKRPSAN